MGEKRPDLFLAIDYDIISNMFCYDGNIKEEMIAGIVVDFICSQLGKGKDKSPAKEEDLYEINIGLDLREDTFLSSHNCGNKSLRDDVLLFFIGRMLTQKKS